MPSSLIWSALAMLGGAPLVLFAGATLAHQRRLDEAFQVLFIPLLIAGTISSLIAIVQIFFSDLAGNALIANASFSQRASGNLRQPNHLSSLALWALVGVIWLRERSYLNNAVAQGLTLALVGSVVLTGSRTGLLGILILAGWAIVDRSLSRFSRRLLWAMPLVYALGWWLFKLWASSSLEGVGTVDRISAGGDISSARFAIWSNSLELIRSNPWFGVGFGEFNLAWSLTPFPGRPTQFYDHTHNLLLQWAVELGLPLALLLTAACALAVWRAWRAAERADAVDRSGLRAAFMLILLIMLHSMLEYPLWYSYFLLPTMFAFGICLGSQATTDTPAALPRARSMTGWLAGAGAVMLAVTAYSVADFHKVVVIFSPPADALPLEARIEAGKRSLFFAHHADYAAATTGSPSAQTQKSFYNASHFLLDTRFMLAWAKAYAAQGDLPRARFLADRLREFQNDASAKFFEVCDRAAPGGGAKPFQCSPAETVLDFRDFR